MELWKELYAKEEFDGELVTLDVEAGGAGTRVVDNFVVMVLAIKPLERHERRTETRRGSLVGRVNSILGSLVAGSDDLRVYPFGESLVLVELELRRAVLRFSHFGTPNFS
jgi:hypothetical protein